MRWALWRGTLLYEIIVPVTQPLYMLEDVIIHWLISCVRQDVPVDIYFNAVIISQKIYLLIISEIWCLGLTFSESKLYLILCQASFDIEACHSDSTKMNSHAVFKYVSNLQTILKAWWLVQLSVFPLWCISFPQNISQFTENWFDQDFDAQLIIFSKILNNLWFQLAAFHMTVIEDFLILDS